MTGSDCASKLFMAILYGLYTCSNIDYGSVLWAQVVQSTLSTTHQSEISCARFWTLVVNRSIEKLKIPVMQNIFMASISNFHTTGIIVSDFSKFSFIGSIPEAMFRDKPPLEKYWRGTGS